MDRAFVSAGRMPTIRRAYVALYVLVGLTATLGFAALAVDVGMLYSAKSELQRAADASALTSAWSMLDANRVKGGSTYDAIYANSKAAAVTLANKNVTLSATGTVNSTSDITLGHVNYGGNPAEVFNSSPLSTYNAANIVARRNSTHGGSIALFFARALGVSTSNLNVDATAAFWDSIDGFKVTNTSGNSGLLRTPLS